MIHWLLEHTCYFRRCLAADIHHLLTMPDFYYLEEEEIIKQGDEFRVGKDECWAPVHNTIGLTNLTKGFVRRSKNQRK
jgi:hypothetical protein